MRWEGQEGSSNVEDRRGQRAVGKVGGGIGCCGVLLVLVISLITGKDPRRILALLGGSPTESRTETSRTTQPPAGPPRDELGRFASVVLRDTEKTWSELLASSGSRYEEPKLVLFTRSWPTACGRGSAATGPFYCPADRKVYIDLSFFDELSRRFGAPGDFAQAYVIAHEVGHHVQNLDGTSGQVHLRERRSSKVQSNALSVRLELQADCYAGVWGFHARKRGLIEPGDFEEGLRAAAAIGDDQLQQMARGTIQPESFTHGSSEQRVEWLRRGLQSGEPSACNTFGSR